MASDGGQLYLDLMKKILTNVIYEDPPTEVFEIPGADPMGNPRHDGRDWPSVAHTMIGLRRMDNLHSTVERVLSDDVPGDLVETGVWRGGACIFMRAALRAHGVKDRRVWVVDSFEGMPDVSAEGDTDDAQLKLHLYNDVLGVSLDQVRRNFDKYGLLDDQVEFLQGWFADTLPTAPIDRVAVLRLDGDLYSSTMDSLTNLYPKVSPGGFVIVDDYVIPGCARAIHDFRAANGITEPLIAIDDSASYWRRAA
jgi:hypothetical protein